MKSFSILIIIGLIFSIFSLSLANNTSKIESQLLMQLSSVKSGEKIIGIVYLNEQANTNLVKGNPEAVIRMLQETANKTQKDLLTYLEREKHLGNVVEYKSMWIQNMIFVTSSNARIFYDIADFKEVRRIYANHLHSPPKPIKSSAIAPQSSNGLEWNLNIVGIDKVWNYLGVMGDGAVVANLDTGVDVTHPDLASKYRGGSNSWKDFTTENKPTPFDGHGHGTHTMGTMVGGNAGGTYIGAAPNAKWIAGRIFDSNGNWAGDTEVYSAFQWILDPDNNPSTRDEPDVCNNSWGGCDQTDTTFYGAIQNWVNAGIFPVFSAGNAGNCGIVPAPNTAGAPGILPNAYQVGATDSTNTITDFSLWGPAPQGYPWYGIMKPDISAPGQYIKSSIPGGSYDWWDGTSMSAPLVSGVVALMKSANHNLSIDQIRNFLNITALDKGDPGQDMKYGWGIVNAFGAVSSIAGPIITHTPLGWTENIAGPYTINANITKGAAGLKPETFKLFYKRSSNAWTLDSLPMNLISENTYSANILGSNIDPDTISYYISAGDSAGKTSKNPPFGWHTFRAGTDNIPPTITHRPRSNTTYTGPFAIQFSVIDPMGVNQSSVKAYYKINNGNEIMVNATSLGSNKYVCFIADNSVSVNDFIHYYITAKDNANNPNTARLPTSGYYSFKRIATVIMSWDFEASNGGWTSSSGWQWGTDSKVNAHSGTKLWGTVLNGNYGNNVTYNLTTPSIDLTTFGTSANLTFYHWYEIEDYWDGSVVEISTNGGTTFNTITPVGGYPGYANVIDSDAYTGYSNGWVIAQFNLNSYITYNNVRLRFRFVSDNYPDSEYLGWYIDDVTITNQEIAPIPRYLITDNGHNSKILLRWSPPSLDCKSQGTVHEAQASSIKYQVPNIKSQIVDDNRKSKIKRQTSRDNHTLLKNDLMTNDLMTNDLMTTDLYLKGYNVYRGTAPGVYNSTPLNNTLLTTTSFVDEPVANDVKYYYVVTAVYDGTESSYSNEAIGIAFVENTSFIAGTTTVVPTIDGIISAGEWIDAIAIPMRNPYIGYITDTLLVKNDCGKLYIAINTEKDNTLDYEEFGLYFDDDHNHKWDAPPSDEGNFWIWYDITNTDQPIGIIFRSFDNTGTTIKTNLDPVSGPVRPAFAMNPSKNKVQLEVEIDLSASPLQATPGDTIGMRVFWFDNTDFTGFWPLNSTYNKPETFGNMKLSSLGISGTIQGTVTFNSLPLEGVRVEAKIGSLVEGFDITDASGNYSISGLPPCSYTVSAIKQDYWTVDSPGIALSPSEIVIVNFSMELINYATVSGTATLPDTINHSGIVVEITELGLKDTTDVNGNFTLTKVVPGIRTIKASKENYTSADTTLNVGDGANITNVNLKLTPRIFWILLMGEDGTPDDWQAYRTALTNYGVEWDEWDLDTKPYPTTNDLANYNTLIWFDTGMSSASDSECEAVANWVKSGGKNIVLIGNDLGYDFGNPYATETVLWELFKTTYSGDWSDATSSLTGKSGDIIGDSWSSSVMTGNFGDNDYAEISSVAKTSLTYTTGSTSGGKSALTHYTGANYHSVWFGCDILDITNQSHRNTLIGNILKFFATPITSVNLVSFTANVNGNIVSLNWNTMNEDKHLGFNLYRSNNKDNNYAKVNTASLITSSSGKYSFIDKIANEGIYNYKLSAVDALGGETVMGTVSVAVTKNLPTTFAMSQNYPNPFNPQTFISYAIAGDRGQMTDDNSLAPHPSSPVTLKIYSITGQLVRTLVNEKQEPGYYKVMWDGKDDNNKEVSSGIYVYMIRAGEFTATKRMIMMK